MPKSKSITSNITRNFIGIELDHGYFEIARQRIATGTVADAPDPSSNEAPDTGVKQYRLKL